MKPNSIHNLIYSFSAIALCISIGACTTASTEQESTVGRNDIPIKDAPISTDASGKLNLPGPTSNPSAVKSDTDKSQIKAKDETSDQLATTSIVAIEEDTGFNTHEIVQTLNQQSPAKKPAVTPLQKSEPLERKRAEMTTGLSTIQAYSAPAATGVPDQWRAASEPLDRENYDHYKTNPVKLVAEEPVSTFSIDVDTGSYTNVRRILNSGRLPPKDAVRVEEFINYFGYEYPAPKSMKVPFNVITEVGPSPWSAHSHLLHIGIKGYELAREQLPPANLVFLIDVSGSMQADNKLGLLKNSLKLLTQKLRSQDHISIVVYAGASGVILEPTSGNNKYQIMAALDSLSAGGSTNGAAGIRAAYAMAESVYIKDGINRVLLATDGDFNVGTVNFDALKNLVEEKRQSGVFLTTLGFGDGNYNDKLMEQLADVGNGNYAYIDTLKEAQKVLVDEMGSTLKTIAKDVKIQIEFNPAVVAEYRLLGYENRALRREDFNNDKIDAGEIGAGHTVTALYEIVLTNSEAKLIDPLRYSLDKPVKNGDKNSEIAFLRLRYKQPDRDSSQLIESAINSTQVAKTMTATSVQYQFAASVAGFGQLLRGGEYTHQYSFNDVLQLARQAKGSDPFGYRSEFIQLVNLAATLSPVSVPTISQMQMD